MKRNFFRILVILLLPLVSCTEDKTISFELNEGEKVWGGRIKDGSRMPFVEGYDATLYVNSSNQVNPLLLTSEGRYIWSEGPFDFRIEADRIVISNNVSPVVSEVASAGTLSAAFREASARFFPADGRMPPKEFFEVPQYNTWIELMYDQNQQGVLDYAEGILSAGLPAGIIMVDDTWQDDYGKWEFEPGRFPDPKGMVDRLHEMGFKVMLWICPFVSMDQYLISREIRQFDGFLRTAEGEPYPVNWWNGTSAVLDFSNPESVRWFDSQLERLMTDFGIDGFKFDAGDFEYYPQDAVAYGGKVLGCEQCSLFVQLAEKYPFNELRAGWQNAGKPIVQRLHDKDHSWADLKKLIPEMFAEGLMGFSFSCPDMVGGGNFAAFEDGNLNQELLVRSAQCHALMPMMQFSLAPWRVLDKDNYMAVLKAVDSRKKFQKEINALIKRAAETGEPVIAPLEYVFPHQGYAEIVDQFMLGDRILVAPMLDEGCSRKVVMPAGMWRADDGTEYRGGCVISIDVPIDRLPYFIKID